jgi:hypothetical protein
MSDLQSFLAKRSSQFHNGECICWHGDAAAVANSAAYVELLFVGMVLYTVRGSFVVFQDVPGKAMHSKWFF